MSFVCNLCTIFTPSGLYNKINEIYLYVQNSKTSSDSKHDVMLKNHDKLLTTVKVYMKEILSDTRSNKAILQESKSHIDELTQKLKYVEYKIDKIGDETNTYQYSKVIQSFKDFDKTLEKMAEITTNIVESGLERQSKIVSQLNDTVSDVLLVNKSMKEFAANTANVVQDKRKTDNLQQDQLVNKVGAKIDGMLKRLDKNSVNVPAPKNNLEKKKRSNKQKSNFKKQNKDTNSNKFVENNVENSVSTNEVTGVCKLPNGNVVITFERGLSPAQLKTNLKNRPSGNTKRAENKVTFADKVNSYNEANVLKRKSFTYTNPIVNVEDRTSAGMQNSRSSQEDSLKVKIVGLSEKLEEQELNHYLQEQNVFVKSYTKLLNYEESRKPHNKYHRYNAIVEMDKFTYEKSREVGKLNINWDKCYVVEDIQVTRCFNCSGYNHRADKCSNKVACPRCSGEHKLARCNNQEVQCINCLIFNEKLKLKLNTKHSALSKECEVYKRKLQFKKQFLSCEK